LPERDHSNLEHHLSVSEQAKKLLFRIPHISLSPFWQSKSGGAYEIAKKVTEKYVEYETRVSVLGHLQRGGAPSCYDRVLASRMGVAAVEGLLQARKDVMVGIINDRETYTSLEESITRANIPNRDELRIARILSI